MNTQFPPQNEKKKIASRATWHRRRYKHNDVSSRHEQYVKHTVVKIRQHQHQHKTYNGGNTSINNCYGNLLEYNPYPQANYVSRFVNSKSRFSFLVLFSYPPPPPLSISFSFSMQPHLTLRCFAVVWFVCEKPLVIYQMLIPNAVDLIAEYEKQSKVSEHVNNGCNTKIVLISSHFDTVCYILIYNFWPLSSLALSFIQNIFFSRIK